MGGNVTIVKFDHAKIQRLSTAALAYLDDGGNARSVNFSTCRMNFVRDMRAAGNADDKYVGFRDSSATPPYITLLTDPPTRFEFPSPGPATRVPGAKFLIRNPQDFRAFHEFEQQLREVGAATIDLS
jgi:hypothetical protein